MAEQRRAALAAASERSRQLSLDLDDVATAAQRISVPMHEQIALNALAALETWLLQSVRQNMDGLRAELKAHVQVMSTLYTSILRHLMLLTCLMLVQTLSQHQSVFERQALRKHLDYLPVDHFEELKLNPDDLDVLIQYPGSVFVIPAD